MDRRLLIGVTPNFDDGRQHIPVRYVRAIEYMGGEATMIPFESTREQLEEIADRVDGILYSGGVDVDPSSYGAEREPECGMSILERDRMEIMLLEICLKRRIPVFGICRGCQIINVALGGTLVQDVPSRFGSLHQMPRNAPSIFWHDVRVVPGTMLYDVLGGDRPVDSYHHQFVDKLADGLIPTAYAPDGFVEAYELPEGEQFLMAVQWHPEVTQNSDVYSRRLFDRFRQAIVG